MPEASNKINLLIWIAYGFRDVDSMIGMIMLFCSSIEIPWLGRKQKVPANKGPATIQAAWDDPHSCTKSTIIVDFFSGSASTAHAVMQLNAEDGGNRKFIMVQLPEPCADDSEAAKAGYKNICEIGKERIRRAGKKIAEELSHTEARGHGEKADDLFDEAAKNGGESIRASVSPCEKKVPDIGFRVLKLSDGSYHETFKNVGEITQESLLNFSKIKDDRTGEDLLFQVLLETDIKLSESIVEEIIEGNKVYFVGGTAIAAALEKDMKMTEEFVKALAARKPGTMFFRDDAFGGKDDLKISVGQIFKQMTGDLTKVKVIWDETIVAASK